ncbi:MAG: hypothetical protein HQL27_01565 [Candidatus Omnitrophica bacterium]|nr:hypothetical protein [Candidatus Omnitrophota bacterium]
MAKKPPTIILFLAFLFAAATFTLLMAWQRCFSFTLGRDALSSCSILASFFFGIGLGSYFCSRLTKKFNRERLFFGISVVFSGLYGVVLLSILKQDPIPLSGKLFAISGCVKYFPTELLLVLFLSLPGTFAAGSAVSAFINIACKNYSEPGKEVSLIFGTSALGACTGCLFFGFIMMPIAGIEQSAFIALLINVFIALFFVVKADVSEKGHEAARPVSALIEGNKWLLSLFFLSGVLVSGYHTTWLRVLSFYSPSRVVNSLCAVSVFLSGIAIGCIFLYAQIRKMLNNKEMLVLSCIGVGLACLVTVPLCYSFPSIAQGLLYGQRDMISSVSAFKLWQVNFILSFLSIFLPSLFIGLGIPCAYDMFEKEKKYYSLFTGLILPLAFLGMGAGVLIFVYLVLPCFGLHGSLGMLSFCCILCGLAAAYILKINIKGPERLLIYPSLIIAMFFGIGGLPFVRDNVTMKKKGAFFKYERARKRRMALPVEQRLLHYKAYPGHTISVLEEEVKEVEAQRTLQADSNIIGATDFYSRAEAKLTGHIPLALNLYAKDILLFGFGTGEAAASILLYDVALDCVEAERGILKAQDYFKAENKGVLKNPRLKMIVNDPRRYLNFTDRKYDVIALSSSLFYEKSPGFYTREYFLLIKRHLNRNGIAAVWIPLSGESNFDSRVITRSFLSVFPNTTAWYAGGRHLLLVSSEGEPSVDYSKLNEIFSRSELKDDLAQAEILSPVGFVKLFLLDEKEIKNYSDSAFINEDNFPFLDTLGIESVYDNRNKTAELFYFAKGNKFDYIKNAGKEERRELLKALMPRLVNQF